MHQLFLQGGKENDVYRSFNRVFTRVVQELAGRAKHYQQAEMQIKERKVQAQAEHESEEQD